MSFPCCAASNIVYHLPLACQLAWPHAVLCLLAKPMIVRLLLRCRFSTGHCCDLAEACSCFLGSFAAACFSTSATERSCCRCLRRFAFCVALGAGRPQGLFHSLPPVFLYTTLKTRVPKTMSAQSGSLQSNLCYRSLVSVKRTWRLTLGSYLTNCSF